MKWKWWWAIGVVIVSVESQAQLLSVDTVATTDTINAGRIKWNNSLLRIRDTVNVSIPFRDNGTNITLRTGTDTLSFGTGTNIAKYNFFGTGVFSTNLSLGIASGTTGELIFKHSGNAFNSTLTTLSQSASRTFNLPVLTQSNDTLLTYALSRSILTGSSGLASGGTGAALTAVPGAVAYSGGAAIAFTAAGTSGQILQSAGTGAPTWVTPLTDNVTTNWIGYKSASSTWSDAVFWNNTNKTIGVDISTGLETDAGVQISTASGSRYYYSNAYGGTPGFMGLHAAGTRASPTATASGNTIAVFGGKAYTGTAYETNPSGAMQVLATQTHSATNQGTKLQFVVVANNATTRLSVVDITSNGIEILPSYSLRNYDTDGGNYGTFAIPDLSSNITYTMTAASGDVAVLSANGFAVRTGAQTYASRSFADAAAGLTWTNANGVAGNPTPVFANDLGALEGLSSNGIASRTGTDTWAVRTITQPAAGITVSNGDGVSGNPTLALANDLSGVEGLAGDGLAVRTGVDTWTLRDLVAGTNTTVTNGDGVSGNLAVNVADASTSAKGAVQLSTNGEATTGEAVQGDDGRLPRIVYRTTDTTTTSATQGNLGNLAFSVTSGVTYKFEFTILYQSSATTASIELGLTTPSVTSFGARVGIHNASDGANAEVQGYISASSDSVAATSSVATATTYVAIVTGVIKPSASGTLQLLFSNDDGASTITVLQGSNGMIWAFP